MSFFSVKQEDFVRNTLLGMSKAICVLPDEHALSLLTAVGISLERLWACERARMCDVIDRVYQRAKLQPPIPIKKIVRRCCIHFTILLGELLRYPRVTPEYLRRRICLNGVENLDEGLALGRGLIVALPHIGNWEYLGAAIVERGYRLNSFYLAQKDDGLGRMLDHFRTYSGIVLHERDRAAVSGLRALRGNEILGMVADQDGGNNGIYMDFLGHWVSVAAGPANWSLKTGAPLMPIYALRRGLSFNYDAYFLPAFEDECGQMSQQNRVISRTKKLVAWMEQLILQHPEQYLWFYDRFKPRHEAWITKEINKNGQMWHGTARYSH
jgi:KDO2-lipid IV(A) lauroyltransferase